MVQCLILGWLLALPYLKGTLDWMLKLTKGCSLYSTDGLSHHEGGSEPEVLETSGDFHSLPQNLQKPHDLILVQILEPSYATIPGALVWRWNSIGHLDAGFTGGGLTLLVRVPALAVSLSGCSLLPCQVHSFFRVSPPTRDESPTPHSSLPHRHTALSPRVEG